jgi:hypothetical protein
MGGFNSSIKGSTEVPDFQFEVMLEVCLIYRAVQLCVRKLSERESSMFCIQADGITYCFVWFSMTDFLSPLYVVACNREDAIGNWNKSHN